MNKPYVVNYIPSVYYELQKYKETFENLKKELKFISIKTEFFNSAKILLVDISKVKVDESLSIPRRSTSKIATKIKRVVNTDTNQISSNWMERFINSFLDLEELLFNYYILNNLGELKVRKPSKHISDTLDAKKPETMLNRVLQGVSILLRYDNYILKTEYKEIQRKKTKVKREEKKKLTEEKKLEEKKKKNPFQQFKQMLMKFRITFFVAFSELILIILASQFNQLRSVRILTYVLIPLLFIAFILGFIFERRKK